MRQELTDLMKLVIRYRRDASREPEDFLPFKATVLDLLQQMSAEVKGGYGVALMTTRETTKEWPNFYSK